MKIVFNGTEYDGPEAMPVEVRAAYEAALALARHRGLELPGVQVKVNVTRSVRYNGVAYEDTGQLPEEARQALERQGGLGALAGRSSARRRSTPAEIVAVGLLLSAMVLALALYLGEYRALEYTFDDDRLFLWGLGFGVLTAWPLLQRLLPHLTTLLPAWRAIYALLLGFALTGAGAPLACKLNRELAREPAQSWTFTITAKRHIPQSGRSSATWEVRAEANGRRLRFEVPPSAWSRLQIGRSYTGEVRKGYLGYPFLTDAGLR